MADNLTLDVGSGGGTVATDEVSGIHYQRVKANFGGDGTATDVDVNNPLPILASGTVAVSGTPNVHVTNAGTIVPSGTQDVFVTNNGTVTANGGTLLGQAGTVNVAGTPNVFVTNAATVIANGGTLLGQAGTVTVTGVATESTLDALRDMIVDVWEDATDTLWTTVRNTPNVFVTNSATVTANIGTQGTILGAAGTVTALQGTDPWVVHQDNNGTVSVSGTANVFVTNSGTVTANLGTGGTAATSLGKAEDAIAADGDTGVAVFAVRRDAASSGVNADGDYANLSVDSNGALRVVGSSAATEYTEDAASVADPVGGILIGRRRDTLTVSEVSTDGDNIALNATNKGQLHTYAEISSVPAAARTTDTISAALATDAIMASGTVVSTPKRAFDNIAASTTAGTLVAGTAGFKIRVLQVAAVAGATVTSLTFNSATTAISPLFANAGNGGEVLPFSPIGWFETVAGSALTVTTGAGTTTGILVGYIEVA